MEFIILKINSPTWNSLWDELASHPINDGIADPSTAEHNGNSWEYRGSYKQGKKLLSEFLHRTHPVTNNLYTVVISRELDKDDDIERRTTLR